jgi:hypothetical protein
MTCIGVMVAGRLGDLMLKGWDTKKLPVGGIDE